MKHVNTPSGDTQDGDPTRSIQQMQKKLIREQGGRTEFTGVADRARGKNPDRMSGDDPDPETAKGDRMYENPASAVGSEYNSRDFGKEDNASCHDRGDYGDFII